MEPIYEKITAPKESIKTQNVTNVPNFISQSEAPAPKEIMVQTCLSVFSGVTIATGYIVTPEKLIPRKKIKN